MLVNKLKETITYFQEVGIEDNYSPKEKIRIKTSNELIMMGFLVVAIREIFNVFVFEGVIESYAMFAWFGIYFFAHLLTRSKQHQLARVVVMGSVLLFAMSRQIAVGHNNIAAEPIYALLIYFSILFYNKKIQNIVIPGIILCYVGTIYASTSLNYQEVGSVVSQSSQLFHVMTLFGFFFYIARRNVLFSTKNRNELKMQELELKEKNKQLGKFNNIIAHDLKEPIRSIVSFSNLLKRATGNKERRQDYASYVERSAHQLNHLVFGIKEFYELTEMQLVYASVDLNELVNRAKSEVKEDAKKVVIDAAVLPKIYSTKPPLQAVFSNLIENGIRFNNNEEVRIKIWSVEKDNQLYIYFKDNGIGIEPEYQETVFEMFKRLGTDDTKSPGLGLNLSRRVVERLRGNLVIESSTMGEGTTFCLSLPNDETSVERMKEKEQEANTGFNVVS